MVRMVLEDLRTLGQGKGVSLYARGRKSINEVRLVVVEMGDGEIGRKFSKLSCESFGKDERMKRVRLRFEEIRKRFSRETQTRNHISLPRN